MQLRRETTCLTAMRQAMDAGDYQTALQRATELVEMDPSWNEVKLFLEQLQAEAGAARRVERIQPRQVAPAPVTTAKPRRAGRARSRAAIFAVMIVVVAALSGWATVQVLPIDVVAQWIAPLIGGLAPGSTNASVPSPPSPPSPELEGPDLPLAAIAEPPAAPSDAVIGNTVSQYRQETDPVAGSTREPGATRPDATRPRASAPPGPALDRDTPAAAGAVASSGTAPHQTASPAPQLEPNVGMETGTAAAAVSRQPTPSDRTESAPPPISGQATILDATGLQPAPLPAVPQLSAAAPPASSTSTPAPGSPTASPSAPESHTPSPRESVSTLGTSPAPGVEATTAAQDREAAERAIGRTLVAYAQAYMALNATAVKHVWPGVNEDALRNAFGQLESQRIAFTGCTVDVRGLQASAICRGTAAYVPKVGNRDMVTASRQWRFSLRKLVNTWVIDSVASSE
jgi:hypothetical protein